MSDHVRRHFTIFRSLLVLLIIILKQIVSCIHIDLELAIM